jgi:CRISPR-associated protein Csy2
MNETAALLLLPRMRVQNANAVSGPLSWGFPAPSAFTGFVHALERRLRARQLDIEFGGVGIVCHRFEPQAHKPGGRYSPNTFALTRNPLFAGWKGFVDKPAALVEEGRAHMEITLLVQILTEPIELPKDALDQILDMVGGMRLAGGSILSVRRTRRHQENPLPWPEPVADARAEFRRLRSQLLPGFTLVQRDDLLLAHLQDLQAKAPDSTSLDALLDLCRLNIEPVGPDPDHLEDTLWEVRRRPGWLVPLPAGYAALSPTYAPGQVRNARDAETPFRFVESVYTLGQWLSPHRIKTLDDMLWHHSADIDAGIYRCTNRYSTQQTQAEGNA